MFKTIIVFAGLAFCFFGEGMMQEHKCEANAISIAKEFDILEFYSNKVSSKFVNLLEKIAFGSFDPMDIVLNVSFREKIATSVLSRITDYNEYTYVKELFVCLALKETSHLSEFLLAKYRILDQINDRNLWSVFSCFANDIEKKTDADCILDPIQLLKKSTEK